MNWYTDYTARTTQPAPQSGLAHAVEFLKQQIQMGGLILLSREQAVAVVAKLEQQ